MRLILLGVLIARGALPVVAAETPFPIREPKTAQDAAAINQNFRSLSDDVRKFRGTFKDDILDDDNTFTGNNTFSGVTTHSGSVTNSAAVTNSGNVVFNASSTFKGGVFGIVHNSTQALRMTGVSWGTTGLVSRSTLTVVGSTITIHASLNVRQTGAGNVYAGYLIDGLCPSRWTCSATCTSNVVPWESNNDTRSSFTITARETAAHGTHTVSIWACSDAGTAANGTLEFWLEAN